MENYVPRYEYEEYKERMHDEHQRQNSRIKNLEDVYKQQGELLGTIKEIAVKQNVILEEQKQQGKRLDVLEQIPAKRWDTLTAGILGAVAGAIGSALIGLIAGGLL